MDAMMSRYDRNFLSSVIALLADSGGWTYHVALGTHAESNPPGFADIVMTDGLQVYFAWALQDRAWLTDGMRQWIRELLRCESVECVVATHASLEKEIKRLKASQAMYYAHNESQWGGNAELNGIAVLGRRGAKLLNWFRHGNAHFPDLVVVAPPVVRMFVLDKKRRKAEVWIDAIAEDPGICVFVWQPGELSHIRAMLKTHQPTRR
jgi:hypothetical protein